MSVFSWRSVLHQVLSLLHFSYDPRVEEIKTKTTLFGRTNICLKTTKLRHYNEVWGIKRVPLFWHQKTDCKKVDRKRSSWWSYLVETFRKSLLFVSALFSFVPIRSVGCPCWREQREGKTLRFAYKRAQFHNNSCLDSLPTLCLMLCLY